MMIFFFCKNLTPIDSLDVIDDLNAHTQSLHALTLIWELIVFYVKIVRT